MSKKLSSLLLSIIIANIVYAQNNLGVAISNYSRINSMYLNPANIADTLEHITVGFFSLNIGVDNNLGTFPSIGNLGNALNGNDSNSQVFSNSGRKNFSMLVPEVNIHG